MKDKSIRDRFGLTNEEFNVLEATDAFHHKLNEANVIRLDAQTARKRRLRQATLMAAREANDPLYIKYQKASKRRRALRKQIQIKYESKGKLKLGEYEARARERQARAAQRR